MLGLTLGAEVDVIVFLTTRYFGLKNFGALYGGPLAALSLGSAFGPLLAATIYDTNKSYDQFFWLAIGLSLAAAAGLADPAPAPRSGDCLIMPDWLNIAEPSLKTWFLFFLAFGLVAGVVTGFFKARKIQPNGFKWKTFRNEAFFAVINVTGSAFLIGAPTAWLTTNGWITVNHDPVAWWVIAGEYAALFHRLRHLVLLAPPAGCTKSRCTTGSTRSITSQPRPTC